MPCYDDRGQSNTQYVYKEVAVYPEEAKMVIDSLRTTLAYANERRDLLARLLCSLMRHLTSGQDFRLSEIDGLEKWWKEHQKFDETRNENP